MGNSFDRISLRIQYFFAGALLGLMTLAPFSAIIEFFTPDYTVDMYDPNTFFRWPVICGLLAAIFYDPGKET